MTRFTSFCLVLILLALWIASARFPGPTMFSAAPMQANASALDDTPLTNIEQIVAGNSHTCVLTKVGGVKCWGLNESGQLGNGNITNSSKPVDVFGLNSGITAISVGGKHTCALTSSGGVKCWGYNIYGQLGNGGTGNKITPVDVVGLSSGVSAISAGGLHTCALTSTEGIKCWGYNAYGQLGNGSINPGSSTPIAVVGLSSGVSAISTGYGHTCALSMAGGVKCWGYNIHYQLGNDISNKVSTPTDVVELTSGVSAISAGYGHTCALTTVGGVKCWGHNIYGQLGNGGSGLSRTPIDVVGLTSGVSAISASDSLLVGRHTCALVIAGSIKCWGYNSYGQLGNGSTNQSGTPVEVSGLSSGINGVSAGSEHTCALTAVGGVKCWGYNSSGQLGNGSTISTSTPSDVVAIVPVTTTPTVAATPTSLTATPTPIATTTPTSTTTLPWVVLIYLNGDNDLDSWAFTLFNQLEEAVAQKPSLKIRVLWDRSGVGDTVLYHVQPDQNPHDLASYSENVTRWVQGDQGELDMGSPETLLNFIIESRQDFPPARYRSLLSIVDHGGGWSPELLDPQKSRVRYIAGASGFSWDWSNGYSYLSTQDMAYVFANPTLQNQPLDIVFYDACLMAMVEEAYQLRNSARFLVASQYETWTSFPYLTYLTGIQTREARDQARWMVNKYAESLTGYNLPYTMSAIDLQYTAVLRDTIDNLAITLDQKLPDQKSVLLTAFERTQKLDYDYDFILRNAEGYVDLGDFVKKLSETLPDTEIQTAAQGVLDVLDLYVSHELHNNGDVSQYVDVGIGSTKVILQNVTGISIYLPLGEDDPELLFYRGDQIDFAQETFWDDFIRDFRDIFQPQAPGSGDVGGRGKKPQPLSPQFVVYLPAVLSH